MRLSFAFPSLSFAFVPNLPDPPTLTYSWFPCCTIFPPVPICGLASQQQIVGPGSLQSLEQALACDFKSPPYPLSCTSSPLQLRPLLRYYGALEWRARTDGTINHFGTIRNNRTGLYGQRTATTLQTAQWPHNLHVIVLSFCNNKERINSSPDPRHRPPSSLVTKSPIPESARPNNFLDPLLRCMPAGHSCPLSLSVLQLPDALPI